jgi:glycosyltransferase involved in cell wall biosynthesis
MHKLSVVIPALNEENGISDIVERVLAIEESLAKVGVSALELIIVDDGSQDRTAEIVAGYPNVVLVQHPVNKGYGAAIKTGFRRADGDLLAFLDADGTYPPEYFPQLCQPILKDQADLVIGSRMAGSDSQMPLVRRVGNTIFATLVSIISNRRVTDSASGQRVFRSEILSHLYPLPDGLNFTPVMSTRAMHEQIKVVEIPIPYSERVGRSKLSVVHDGLRFLNSILVTALTYNPVRLFGLVGFGMIILGLAIGLFSLLAFTTGFNTDQFATLFAGLVLISGGVNVFSGGTLFNYIVSLFHKRQIRQGIFGRPLFRTPLEKHFGWLGLGSVAGGIIIYGLAVWQQWTGPGSMAPWFAPAVSTVMVLTGLNLMMAWLQIVVLAELSRGESKANQDMVGIPVLETNQPREEVKAVKTVSPLAG